MVAHSAISKRNRSDGKLIAVLGPTNTGKTHLAIERLCGHSSGMIGFPLRLLAREVYDRVCAMKGERNVALITGEERIEPPDARWLLCTLEAMPLDRDVAFVAIDEIQLCSDRERGHIFTDRLLHARGREETMLLGSATMQPMVRALLPEAEIVGRPRFSTLSHAGAKKLSRVPPRSAIVAFSAEQVYAVAELLRRFRGGAAVVMGALSPQTRNAQVAMYQSGEVDYLVATDAIGMGLNLDLDHVVFAGLSKFDGQRQRRLTTSEMAQIAGRAGRHHRDGTFGTLSGTQAHDAELTSEEIYAIEEHRFAPVTRLFWRESEPRLDSLDMLIADLSEPPERPELAPAPEAIDLAVMRRLAEDPAIAAQVRGRAAVIRFREVCMLPDFRSLGAEMHSRFVARLWEDLRRGALPTDFIAARIAELDNPAGDIDALQGRIAAIRSWSYITQRPDWVLARDEMAARARAAEARLSDALHARLSERFVNRRLSVLMKGAGADSALLPVTTRGDDILVDGESIGKLEGFLFSVDPGATHGDRKMFFAAAERHLPQILAERARLLADQIGAGSVQLAMDRGAIVLGEEKLAYLVSGRSVLTPTLKLEKALEAIPQSERGLLAECLDKWLTSRLSVLEPLHRLDEASRNEASGPELRALLIQLVESGGVLERAGSGFDKLSHEQRLALYRLGTRVGVIDIFVKAIIRPAAQDLWRELVWLKGKRLPSVPASMPPVIPSANEVAGGYRRLGKVCIRVDVAEKLLHELHDKRARAARMRFFADDTKARTQGLLPERRSALFRLAGFREKPSRALAEGELGPPAVSLWQWAPHLLPTARTGKSAAKPPREPARSDSAFAALAELIPQKAR
jgi:ATP-dependent RNA helicase SUPV3L1/SUV3